MSYPVKESGTISPTSTLTVPFRPAAAGLVTVIAIGSAGAPSDQESTSNLFELRLEILKPGTAAPVAVKDGSRTLPGESDTVVLSADAPAGEADLGGDWIARLTNLGTTDAICDMTARYQILAGNLGKVDHVVVLMMENRSFDHMLGYLRVEGGRAEVDGLIGAETNQDDSGKPIAVHPLVTDGRTDPSYFGNDPNHGWPDVSEQLGWDPATNTFTGEFNSGFVRNFAKKLANDAQDFPPMTDTVHDRAQINSSGSRVISFRPLQPGAVTVSCRPRGQIHSDSDTGERAEVSVRRSGSADPVVTAKSNVNDDGVQIVYNATADDLVALGDWTCEIFNPSDGMLTYTTDITFVVVSHLGLEPAAAIMGYYNGGQLPTYKVLADEFAICNRWFASLPTDTFPNRLYSITGGSGGLAQTPSADAVATNPPGYTLKTIFEVLQERAVSWQLFFSNFPFPLIFKTLASDAQYTRRMRALSDFFRLAEAGDLPSVSWIEPNFSDVQEAIKEPRETENDDHPAGYVNGGQQLVRAIYNALSSSPAWSKTLFVIMYDEHGGFYDHVRPPGTPPFPASPDGPPDDDPNFRRYGVRVPAFVVSPWVARRSVSNEVYDHTTILATILRRFCADSVPSMGQRTDHAADLGSMLSEAAPRPAPPSIEPVAPPAVERVRGRDPNAFGVVLRKALIGV